MKKMSMRRQRSPFLGVSLFSRDSFSRKVFNARRNDSRRTSLTLERSQRISLSLLHKTIANVDRLYRRSRLAISSRKLILPNGDPVCKERLPLFRNGHPQRSADRPLRCATRNAIQRDSRYFRLCESWCNRPALDRRSRDVSRCVT